MLYCIIAKQLNQPQKNASDQLYLLLEYSIGCLIGRLKNVEPCTIQVGDIEVLMFILFIPVMNNRFKMTVKLCGIIKLDTNVDAQKFQPGIKY